MTRWKGRAVGLVVGAVIAAGALLPFVAGPLDRADAVIAMLDRHCLPPVQPPDRGMLELHGPDGTMWHDLRTGLTLSMPTADSRKGKCTVSDLFTHLSDEDRTRAVERALDQAQAVIGPEAIRRDDSGAFEILVSVALRDGAGNAAPGSSAFMVLKPSVHWGEADDPATGATTFSYALRREGS